MEKIEIIPCDRYNLELSLDSIIKNGGSIYEFLSFLNIDNIIMNIEKQYKRKPQYHVKGMIMLSIAYHYYDIGYKKTLKKLSTFDKDILNFKDRKVPSSSKLCDFVTKQISENILEEIMLEIALMLYKIIDAKVWIKIANFDSTPIEASRYDKYAVYNPHYKCKMYKGHIMMFGTIPLFMKFTHGVTNDKEPMDEILSKINPLNFTFHEFNLDAGYDKYELFAQIWHGFGARPNIAIREDAISNNIGNIEQIDNSISKYWREGVNKSTSFYKKLSFLFSKDKLKQVGAYFRNKVVNSEQGFAYPFRSHQERIHAHIKKSVKFDVKYVHNKNKKLHTMWSFISYQLLSLVSLQNGLKPNKFDFIL